MYNSMKRESKQSQEVKSDTNYSEFSHKSIDLVLRAVGVVYRIEDSITTLALKCVIAPLGILALICFALG